MGHRSFGARVPWIGTFELLTGCTVNVKARAVPGKPQWKTSIEQNPAEINALAPRATGGRGLTAQSGELIK
jgi:hypothetical protein